MTSRRNITYLGPEGCTFSAIAYDRLAKMYGAPAASSAEVSPHLADSNEEILPLLLQHGGFGSIAVETHAQGRVDTPINSFIELLRSSGKDCPIQVIGGADMEISFALMARPNASKIQTVIAHPKALGACSKNLKKLGVNLMESPSNGKAAETVSLSDPASGMAALGPVQAAEKFGLKVLKQGFEDLPARTTFFLMGPRDFKIAIRPSMTSLTVFRTKDQPGALVKVLLPYSEEGVNLRYIHSLHYSDGVYDFAIITEDAGSEAHVKATARAAEHMDRWIRFGPFPIETI